MKILDFFWFLWKWPIVKVHFERPWFWWRLAIMRGKIRERRANPPPDRMVLAGTFHQAQEYARKMQWPSWEWRYLDGPDALKGRRKVEVYRVGTWYERNDLGAIMDEIRAINDTAGGNVT